MHHYDRAAKAWNAIPRPYDSLRSRQQAATCLLHVDPDQGQRDLLRVLREFSACGGTRDAGRVAQELRRLGVPVRRPGAGRPSYGSRLSPRELEVAELAAAGRTNKQIGEALALAAYGSGTAERRDAEAERRLPNVAISRDGTLIAVGAWGHASTTGAAYVFRLDAGSWTQVAEFTNTGGVPGDGLGTSVSMTPTGSTIVVGANGVNDYAGAGFVYMKRHGHWKRSAELTASDPSEDAGLGSASAISADGSRIVLGAYLAGSNMDGSAYVFTNSSGEWAQSAELKSAEGTRFGYFGWSVGLSADGTTAVVSSDANDGDAGTAYVFQPQGGSWTQSAEFRGTDTAGGDQFGISVAINAKGNTIVAGALSHNSAHGAFYVFKSSGSDWQQQAELSASDGETADYLGAAVATSSDGSTIIGGAWGRDSGDGAAYLFKK